MRIVLILFLWSTIAQTSPLKEVSSFAYQLQDLDTQELINSDFDLLVIDYSKTGSVQDAFKNNEIQTMQNSDKTVLAYLSIGEAEEYRYYFKRKKWIKRDRNAACNRTLKVGAPTWLDRSNRNWCGNYKVKHWQRAWQKIIFGRQSGKKKSYLDRIIDAGFDGVYLDIVDGFEYWRKQNGPRRRSQAAKDMFRFIKRIANYARKTHGKSSFLIVPQNAPNIIDHLSDKQTNRYFEIIDGIATEDTFYFGNADEDNTLDIQTYTLSKLEEFKSAGLPIFAIDYLRDPNKIQNFKTLACQQGFVPQVALRALNNLSSNQLSGC